LALEESIDSFLAISPNLSGFFSKLNQAVVIKKVYQTKKLKRKLKKFKKKLKRTQINLEKLLRFK
jgi:hypothetical protein